MTTPTSDEIRKTFLEYFRVRGHEVVASSGVIPRNDPTLLFTNAGMVQFKDVFLGSDKRGYTRATTSQKCVRMSGKHNDLENVGRTARHHTFFEMLGNFSFGDYFKRDAITYAWELLTQVWKLPPDKLCITVFGGEGELSADDETRAIWREVTGFSDERIVGLGRADNFWTMGETGPCGPCTEIHYFMGEGVPDLSLLGAEPTAKGTGWVEIWNNVFMQYNRAVPDGPLAPLPAPCVDTGMGLERITAVLQGVTSNYDTDLLRPLVDFAAARAGRGYSSSDNDYDVALRVISDHARMTAFALAEGITPDKKGRGAALRSVMRRAIRHAYVQKIPRPFFHHVVAEVIARMGCTYPEIVQHKDFILAQVEAEEGRFYDLVPKGLGLLERFDGWMHTSAGQRELPGAVAHDLNATYGFPLDLTQLLGREQGFVVDLQGYTAAEEAHEEISRGARDKPVAGVSREERVDPKHREALARIPGGVRFVGYDTETLASTVVALLRDDGDGLSFVTSLPEGSLGQVVTRETPFYGEAGGQVGDRGSLTAAGVTVAVTDTQKPLPGLTVHHARVSVGALRVGDSVTLTVDPEARAATRRNHSATHLLHWALRRVLGAHAQQRGSKVGPEILRFDYASLRAITDDEILRIEDLVNREVLANLAVRTEVTSQAEARARGAMMIFEEKYGDAVRMLHIGHESVELCGGTHVARTGDIGLFKIVAETGVGGGVRRIEAVTGLNALALVRSLGAALQRAGDALGVAPSEVPPRVDKALEHQRELQREVQALKQKLMDGGGVDVTAQARTVGDVRVLAVRSPVHEPEALRMYADKLRDKLGNAVVVLGAIAPDGKAVLLCAVSKSLVGRFHAGKIVGELAALVGGRGGGRPDLAQAGGPDAAKLDEALARAYAILG